MVGILFGFSSLLLAGLLFFFPIAQAWELFAGLYLLSFLLALFAGKKGFYLGLTAIIMNFSNVLILSPILRMAAFSGIRLGNYRAMALYTGLLLLPCLIAWIMFRKRRQGDRVRGGEDSRIQEQ